MSASQVDTPTCCKPSRIRMSCAEMLTKIKWDIGRFDSVDSQSNQSLAGKLTKIYRTLFKVSCPKKLSMPPSRLAHSKTISIEKNQKKAWPRDCTTLGRKRLLGKFFLKFFFSRFSPDLGISSWMSRKKFFWQNFFENATQNFLRDRKIFGEKIFIGSFNSKSRDPARKFEKKKKKISPLRPKKMS